MEEILVPFAEVMGSKFMYAKVDEYENVVTLVFDNGKRVQVWIESDEAGDVYHKSKLSI